MFDPKTNRYPYPVDTDRHYLEVKKDKGIVFDADYPYIDNSIYNGVFYHEISESAERIANGADVTDELCEICNFVKRTGMLDEIYLKQGAKEDLTKCRECPRDNFM